MRGLTLSSKNSPTSISGVSMSHNRTLHIKWNSNQEVAKPDIGDSKPDIENKLNLKTEKNIQAIREAFSDKKIFGRSDLMNVIALKASRASELIKIMLKFDIIEPVSGFGKGKYKFKK